MLWVDRYRSVMAQCSPTMNTAILALNPLSYWTLGSDDANTLTDFGSLGNDLTNNLVPLAQTAGGDGCLYPLNNPTGYMDAGDDIAYEPQTASGLTVFRLVKSRPGGQGSGSHQEIVKIDNTGAGSWRMAYATLPGTPTATILQTNTSAGTTARRSRCGEYAIDTWQTAFTRFSGSATGFHTLRRAGVNQTMSNDGTGTAWANSTQSLKLFGHNGSVGRFDGSLAHVAIFAGQLSDADCATIESAVTADGW
jgi:hypothetical protein